MWQEVLWHIREDNVSFLIFHRANGTYLAFNIVKPKPKYLKLSQLYPSWGRNWPSKQAGSTARPLNDWATVSHILHLGRWKGNTFPLHESQNHCCFPILTQVFWVCFILEQVSEIGMMSPWRPGLPLLPTTACSTFKAREQVFLARFKYSSVSPFNSDCLFNS